MRPADCGWLPGRVATTLTISVGRAIRFETGAMWLSNATCKRPPACAPQRSSSALIQRRAAPMPCVSETVSGLKNYPVTIACKSGTPQRSETYYVGSTRKHYTNTMMIAYGPAEDAEIALGIVIEYGGGGARAGNLVADIFDAYYAMKDGSLTLDETGAGETADTTADGQDAVPETVENNDALAGDTAPAEQPTA